MAEEKTSEYCEMCNHTPCVCDRSDNDPVDMDADAWSEFYAKNPDYDVDHDHSMDY